MFLFFLPAPAQEHILFSSLIPSLMNPIMVLVQTLHELPDVVPKYGDHTGAMFIFLLLHVLTSHESWILSWHVLREFLRESNLQISRRNRGFCASFHLPPNQSPHHFYSLILTYTTSSGSPTMKISPKRRLTWRYPWPSRLDGTRCISAAGDPGSRW